MAVKRRAGFMIRVYTSSSGRVVADPRNCPVRRRWRGDRAKPLTLATASIQRHAAARATPLPSNGGFWWTVLFASSFWIPAANTESAGAMHRARHWWLFNRHWFKISLEDPLILIYNNYG
jgi:hypothetical protein